MIPSAFRGLLALASRATLPEPWLPASGAPLEPLAGLAAEAAASLPAAVGLAAAIALLILRARPAPAAQPPLRAPRGGVRAPRRNPSERQPAPRRGPSETPPGRRPGLKAIGAFAAAAGVAVWIVLALMGSSSDDAGQEVAESGEELPPEPPPPTSLSFRIEPPPEVITNPEIPEEPPEPGPPEAGQAARAVGGVFAPEELESEWASRGAGLIRAGANEMVPLISRMEPVGRRLDPERPVPKAERIELKPPDPEAEPKPRRPRLSAPPAASRTAPAAPSPSPSRRRYTIIMGSFSKEANAERLRERLESEGLPAEVMSVTVNNQPWWRVMSGVFEDQAAAEAYGRELRRKNLVDRPYIMIM